MERLDANYLSDCAENKINITEEHKKEISKHVREMASIFSDVRSKIFLVAFLQFLLNPKGGRISEAYYDVELEKVFIRTEFNHGGYSEMWIDLKGYVHEEI